MELTCHCNGKETSCHVCDGKGKINVDSEKLVQTFVESFHSDDESYAEIGERLLDDYENASQHEKTIINDLFITLCGWSFESLYQNALQPENNNHLEG